MAVTGAVSSIGMPAVVNAMENNLAHTWGAGSGYQDKSTAFSTGFIQTQQQSGVAQAIQEVADAHFDGSAHNMGKNFASMSLGQQASLISGIARQMGISQDMASVAGGNLAGTKGMTELMSFGGKLKNFSTGELIKAGAGKGTIEAAQTLSSLAYMENQGMSPEDFGGSKGMLDTAKAIGDIEGFENSYSLAKAGGYEGSPNNFMSLMREMGYSKEFAESSKLQDIAGKHFGGNEQAMFGTFAAMQYGKTAGAVKKAEQHGWNPDTLGEYMGHMDALSNMGRAGGYKLLGDNKFMSTEQGKVLNEAARFEMLKTAATQGGFAGSDGKVGGAEMYNFLQHHNGSIGAVLGDEQAKLFGHDKGGKFNLSMTPDGNVVATEATRGSMDNTYDVRQSTLTDNPLKTDPSTVWNKAKSMDAGFANTLLSGSPAQQDTMARTVAGLMAQNLFLQRHGVDSEEFSGKVGVSSGLRFGSSGRSTPDSFKNFLGSAIAFAPSADLQLRSSDAYREQIDKIASDYYGEIKGHQQMVNDGIWTKEMAASQLSTNLSHMTHEYIQKEEVSNETKRGRDVTGLKDNR